MKFFGKKEEGDAQVATGSDTSGVVIVDSGKTYWQRLWPVMACGAGLFSDGYINNVGMVLQWLQRTC
jgi:hypothetical protein